MIFKYTSEDGFGINKIFDEQITDTSTNKYIESIFTQFNEGILDIDNLSESTSGLDKALISYTDTCKNSSATTQGFNEFVESSGISLTTLGIKSKLAKVGVMALNSALSFGASLLIGFAVEKVVSGLDSLINSSEIAADAMKQSLNNIKELNSGFKSSNKVVDDYGTRYAELAQSVNQFNGDNINLNSDEYKEFLDISDKLLDTFPELFKSYNQNGQAILNLSGNITSITGSLDDLIQRQRELANIDIVKDTPNVFVGVRESQDLYEKQIKELEEKKAKLYGKKTATSSNDIPLEIGGNGEAYLQKVIDSSETDKITRLSNALNNLGIAYTTTTIAISDGSGISDVKKPYTMFDFNLDEDKEKELISSIQQQSAEISDVYNTEVYKIEKEIYGLNQKISDAYLNINSVTSAWLSTDFKYSTLNDTMKSIADTMVSGINFQELGIDTEEKMQAYIDESILKPLFYATPEVEKAFGDLLDMQSKLSNGEISNDEFTKYANNMFDGLFQNMDEDVAAKFQSAFKSGFSKIGINGNAFTDTLGNLISSWIDKSNVSDVKFDFFSDDYKEYISDYKGYLSDLATWQSDFLSDGFLSSGDIYDIKSKFSEMFDFSEFDTTGDYEKMFTDLRGSIIDKLIDPLNEMLEDVNISDNVKNSIRYAIKSIKEMSDEAFSDTNIIDAYSSSLDNIQNAYNTVKSAISEYQENQYLSLDTVQSLLSLNDKYISLLFNEQGQLDLNTQAYTALTKAKLYEMYVSITADAIDTAKNMETEEEAAEYLRRTTADLSEEKLKLAAVNLIEAQTELDAAKARGEDISNRQSALDTIAGITNNKIKMIQTAMDGLKFDGFFETSSSKTATEKTPFKEEFDWIQNSITNVTDSISSINEELNNTSGFKNRLSLYDDLNVANGKLVDATRQASSAYEKEWIKASGKIGDVYKNKITSGQTFEIEEFTNEKLYNNIKDAQTAYENWQSMLQEYNQALYQQESDQRAKVQTKLELEQTKLDIHSINDSDSMTASQSNTYIEEEEQIKAKILKYDLQLAETYEEKVRLQKEHNQYLKDNQDLIYENNKSERDNKINYYSSRVQDIQNGIDLSETKGNQGTEEQYKSMNDYIEKAKTFERQNLEAALEMRNKATYATPEWEKYNQEIQTAQDNIYNLTTTQIENNRAILQLPIRKIEEANKALEKQLDIVSEYKGKVETAIGAASNLIQNQIDVLTEQKEATEEYFDSQIESINEQKEALTKTNNEIKNQLALEKAQYEFDKVKNQKKTKIFREGEGFVFESDQDAIYDAQESLDDQKYNSAIYELESELEFLEKSKESAIEAIDIQINSLELYKERIDSITEGYQNMLDLQQLISLFGNEAVSKIQNGDLSIIDTMSGIYDGLSAQETSLQLQIEANEKAIAQIETYAEKWNGSSQTIVLAKQSIEKAISDNVKEIESIQQRTDTVKTLSDAWEETRTKLEEEFGFIQNNQITAKDDEASVLEERLNNIKSFAKNASDYLSQITAALSQAESKQEELNKIANQNITSKNDKDLTLKVDTMGEKHTGLKSGYVGESSNTKNSFKYIALSKLKPEEIPYVLLKGEAVLYKTDQENILDNIGSSFTSGLNLGTANIIQSSTKANDVSRSIEFNGDIILQGVHDTDSLAKKIKNDFLLKLDQELYK